MVNARVAFHEAGHAVVAHALGLRSAGITVWFAENRGRTSQVPPTEEEYDRQSMTEAVAGLDAALTVQAAGHAAESILTGENPWERGVEASGAMTDFMHAHEAASAIFMAESTPADFLPGRRDQWVERGTARVKFLVHNALVRAHDILKKPENWRKVEKLATTIINRATYDVGSISGAEVDAILDAK